MSSQAILRQTAHMGKLHIHFMARIEILVKGCAWMARKCLSSGRAVNDHCSVTSHLSGRLLRDKANTQVLQLVLLDAPACMTLIPVAQDACGRKFSSNASCGVAPVCVTLRRNSSMLCTHDNKSLTNACRRYARRAPARWSAAHGSSCKSQ